MKTQRPWRNDMRVSSQIVAACLALVFGQGVASAESSKSSFELDGVKQEFSVVSAFRVLDRSNPDAFETLVFLTKTVPDRESIRDADDPYAVAINDPATEEDYLTLVIDRAGVVGLNASIEGVQYLDSSGLIFGEQGSLAASCSSNSDNHVACVVNTEKEVTTAGGKLWKLETEFDSEVQFRAPGKPVAAGGGVAGEALQGLWAALKEDDLEPILNGLSEERAANYRVTWRTPEENLESAKEDLARMLPFNATVIGGEWRGDDQVSLMVKGEMAGWGETKVTFRVTMLRADGRWGFDFGQFLAMEE